MNIQNKYTSLGKSILSGALCAGVLSAAMAAQANTLQEISQVPLNLSEGVSPNIILTLDESGSMSWSHVPDYSSDVYGNLIGKKGTSITNADSSTRRYRAANTNPMAYNPNIIYEIPPAFNLNGSEKTLTTSFTSAPRNGFRGAVDLDNLSTNYKVILEHRIPSGTLRYSNHPADDFKCELSGFSSNGTKSCVNGPIKFDITRTSSSKCTASATAVPVNKTMTASCSISSNKATASISTSTGVPAYYYEFDDQQTGCTGNKSDPDAGGEKCYSLRFVTAASAYDESGNRLKHVDGSDVNGQENFANWYSFYKTRALATLSAASIAFYDLSSDVRFTWQNLATCTSFTSSTSGSGSCGDNRLKPFNSAHKGEFYNWLYRISFDVSTPLPESMKRAGEYLKTAEPWKKYPHSIGGTNTDDNTYACRPSYHILMTDGMWNANTDAPSDYINDHTAFETPGGVNIGPKNYTTQSPFFAEGSTRTVTEKRKTIEVPTPDLGDLAMHYWGTDLREDMLNKVPTYIPYKNDNKNTEYWDPRNNPAEWQHMTNFMMGLGLTTSLNKANIPWLGTTHEGPGYANLVSGTAWPPATSGSDNNVYDLWHAAVNSRGDFYSVDSPQDMVQAFKDILTRIADRKDSAAMPGISTSLEADGTGEDAEDRLVQHFYQTTFDSSDGWAGDIRKVKKYRQFNEDTKEFEDVTEIGKSARQEMPPYSGRKIYIPNAAGDALQDFTTANAGEADQSGTLASYLSIDPETGTKSGSWKNRLNYLRGDKSKEGDGANDLRARSSTLGDFLSSKPTIVSGARYLEGFANRLEGNTKYSDFMNNTVDGGGIKGRKQRLYIGGNDGMLHAFETEGMKETFAFIPSAVFPKLNKLTGKKYTHEFYVDGTPVIADVYDGTNWRTILVGTLRAGGQSIFALDITNPDEIKLLWELDNSNFPDKVGGKKTNVKMGYSFSEPTVARLHNGEWAVVTGNGYKAPGSNNGGAALLVINAITGNMISSLEVQSPVTNKENGLSSPRLADYDGDGIADYAYAGDLHGNLWRFDLLGGSAQGPTLTPPTNGNYGGKSDGISKFKVSYDGKPMFTSTSTIGSKPQSITAAPSLVRHPTRKGYLVIFGTGKYFEIGDKTGEESFSQSVYGIWDMKTKAETTSENTITRAQLQEQTITSQTTGVGATTERVRSNEARLMSSIPVEWYEDFDSTKDVVKRGWYLDLQVGSKREGEMVIEKMQTLGNMVVFQTLVPNDDPCAHGSGNWLYAINPATGGRTLHHALDTRTVDGGIVSAIKFGSEGGVSISQNETGFMANAPGDKEPIAPPPDSMGRQSWRMVPDA